MPDDVSIGAVYDNGGLVFSMGLLGEAREDIGASISCFISHRYPDFKPARILDLGCGLGNNTVPWARTYPDAEVHAIDVGAPLLRYGHARAQVRGESIHFHQRAVEDPGFDDESFDLIFSSMLLHEVPPKNVGRTFSEAYRLLKPGGLMLHMELPPNNMTAAYDSFYLDWDSYYNKEPFYKPFRDMDLRQVCADAGFAPDNYVNFVIPSLHLAGRQAILDAVSQQGADVNRNTGRMAKTIQWFCFGAWK
jgi:ubiquinone/menaquinone biosynthesis C-methylase UbiE